MVKISKMLMLKKTSVKVDVATSAQSFGINVKEEASSFDDVVSNEVEELDLVEEDAFEL